MTTTSTQDPRQKGAPVLCPLADTGLIEVAGADADAFLDAQLSRNVSADPTMRATLAGWHDARGRVLALPWALWTGRHWLLLIRGGDTDALVRRMQLFVLRADVRLRNAGADWEAVAVVGSQHSSTAPPFAELGPHPGDVAKDGDGIHVIRVGRRLSYAIAPRTRPRNFLDQLADGSAETAAAEEIQLGLVSLTPQLAGRFTAHMLNLDHLGAVSFDKGCYPGQEVVARTQNLGSVKRRVFLFGAKLPQAPAVGAALLDAGGSQVGEVVRAVALGENGVKLLAVVRVDAVSGVLACASEPGAPLTREALPWGQ